jgi:adenylate cyclase class 2
MVVEIEIKAHVDDPEELSRVLDDIGSFRRHYHKKDRYFGFSRDSVNPLFRLRHDGSRWLCTSKERKMVGQSEQNEETEFEVSDGEAFQRFIRGLGLHVVVEKEKIGSSWDVAGVRAELSTVNDLGHFLELELVLPDECTDEETDHARERLLSLLDRLEIPKETVESRPYLQIIHETELTATEERYGIPSRNWTDSSRH